MTASRFFVLALAGLLASCATQAPKTAPKPPPASEALRLSRVGFDALPGWRDASPADVRLDAALSSFKQSCAVLTKRPDSAPMSGAGYAGTAGDWREVCARANGDAKIFFEQNFTPFAVGTGALEDIGLFTGYFEPEIRGSRTRHDAYQTPVHGLPPDLVRADLGRFIPKLKGEHISGKVAGNALVPYASRAQINANGLPNTKVLFYTDDAVAFFFLQIQGSGRVVFDDGTSARIGYAGENGRPYLAIGRTLIAEGALTKENVSLQTIRAWLAANPGRARSVMEGNESYIFFRETPLGDTALGSTGSMGVALTPLASLAVDQRIHALGAPLYVAAQGPDPVRGLVVAQDIGGAIRGAVRGDIFFGFGPEAEQRAGAMKASGQLYVLLPNALAAKVGASKVWP